MNTTEEFVYKGYYEGISKHERAVHILKSESDTTPYYMFKLEGEIKEGQKVEVNYNHTVPYKSGQLLLGASL